ncbi:MAG: ATP-binding protein [Myxococcota bacterium]
MPYKPQLFPSANEALEVYAAARLRIARLRVRGGDSLKDVVRVLTREVAAALAVARVGVWFLVDERQALSIYHLHTESNEAFEGTLLMVSGFPSYFAALERGAIIDADDALEDPRTAEFREVYSEPLGVTSMLDAPILLDGKVIGVVCHEHVGPRRKWTQEERDFSLSVAQTVAVKVAEAAKADAELALQDMQAHLAEMRQMSMLGRMAAGVAHDLNNLLTVVQGNAEMLATLPDAPAEVRTLAQEIQATAHRGRDLAQELMEFGRQRPSTPRVIQVGDHVERFVATMSRGLGREWSVKVERAGQNGRVMIDPRALERVVLNLTMNAREAMPGGGVVQVGVSDAVVSDRSGIPSNYVLLRVTDTGRGMDPATRERLFEPFFTTKAGSAGEGHGLGLAIVYDIVNRAGGFIHVDSERGRGTSVRVDLPRMA